MHDADGETRDREPEEGSWLDELSLATRIVFYTIIVTLGGFFVLVILELFI